MTTSSRLCRLLSLSPPLSRSTLAPPTLIIFSPSLYPFLNSYPTSGDDPLSRFVNVLISIKPLYAAMKAGARLVLKNSAEKAGVPWESAARALDRQPVAAELEAIRAGLTNQKVVYPDYYTQPFHAYDEGNLCWLAAREIEAATASMALRTFRASHPDLGPAEAQAKLREGIHKRIREYCSVGGEERSSSGSSSSSSPGPLLEDKLAIGTPPPPPFFSFFSFRVFLLEGRKLKKPLKKNSHDFLSSSSALLSLSLLSLFFLSLSSLSLSYFSLSLSSGCSSGISTRYLAAEFAPARVTGLDLSPYFLALAELRERQRARSKENSGSSSSSSSSSVSASAAAQAALPTPAAAGPDPPGRQRIAYLHSNMEATPFPSSSFDLVSVNFVVHECRPFAIDALCKEAARLLKPGAVLAVADNNPASETLQNLPPALFALMKSTEPWSDEYYCYDLEDGMRRAGLEGVVTREADHRHRCVLGRKKK